MNQNRNRIWSKVGDSQVFFGRGFKVIFNPHAMIRLHSTRPETIIVRQHPKHEIKCFVGDLRKEVEESIRHNVKSFSRMFKKYIKK